MSRKCGEEDRRTRKVRPRGQMCPGNVLTKATCVKEGGRISPAQGREKTNIEDGDTIRKTETK